MPVFFVVDKITVAFAQSFVKYFNLRHENIRLY